jgi:hypothetical protein
MRFHRAKVGHSREARTLRCPQAKKMLLTLRADKIIRYAQTPHFNVRAGPIAKNLNI